MNVSLQMFAGTELDPKINAKYNVKSMYLKFLIDDNQTAKSMFG